MKISGTVKRIICGIVLFTFCFFLLSCSEQGDNVPSEEENNKEIVSEEQQKENDLKAYRQWFYDCLKESADFETAEKGDYVLFGKWEQDGIAENGQENLQWIVAEETEEYTVLVSRFCIEFQKFHIHPDGAPWKNSFVRGWLNGEFLSSAFSDEERLRIIENEVKSGIWVTKDRVYLLSAEEALLYFETPEERIAEAVPKISRNRKISDADNNARVSSWWLLTQGGSERKMTFVTETGEIAYSGANEYDGLNFLRPSIKISK